MVSKRTGDLFGPRERGCAGVVVLIDGHPGALPVKTKTKKLPLLGLRSDGRVVIFSGPLPEVQRGERWGRGAGSIWFAGGIGGVGSLASRLLWWSGVQLSLGLCGV